MFDWPAALFSSPAARPAREGFRFSPSLECLNDRVVPAVVTVPKLDLGPGPAVDVTAPSVWLDQLREAAEKAPDAVLGHLIETTVTAPSAVPRVGGEASEWLSETSIAGGTSEALPDDITDRIVEAFRAAPAGEKWEAVRRVWIEARPAGPLEGLWHPLAAPLLPVQSVANVADHEPAAPAQPPTPAPTADPSIGAGRTPKAHYDWWVISVSDEPPPPVAPPGPPASVVPPSPAPDEPQQPAPRSGPEPACIESPDILEGAGVITRFLPFDTAGLRDGVSDFLCGLEPAFPEDPNQLFGGWELGAAILTGAGAALAIWKRRPDRRKRALQTAVSRAGEADVATSDVGVAWPAGVNR